MWHKEFRQSNGIFVEQTANLKIQGAEFIKKTGKIASGANRRQVDPLVGKTVIIIGGEWK